MHALETSWDGQFLSPREDLTCCPVSQIQSWKARKKKGWELSEWNNRNGKAVEFCRVASLRILMLLCAVKARQIRSCLNEALIALHSNVTNNPECGTWSLFSSFSFIWRRWRAFETIHYNWSWLLFFATEQSLFVLEPEDPVFQRRLMTSNRIIKTMWLNLQRWNPAPVHFGVGGVWAPAERVLHCSWEKAGLRQIKWSDASNLSVAAYSTQIISSCWFEVPVSCDICSATKQIINILFICTAPTSF